jgi:competence protein ComEA
VRWPNAISILTLAVSAGTLVITATGTGNTKADDSAPPRSLPIAIGADGRQARLDTLLSAGEVGVIAVGGGKTAPPPAAADSAEQPAPTKAPPKPKTKTPAQPAAQPCVDINAAAEPALITIKGIGPALAANIIEYRRAHGPFKKKEDIMKVKGIGPAKFANIEGRICF